MQKNKMDGLEQLRQSRLLELQQETAEEQQAQQQIAQLEALVKSKMTKEAVSRYAALKSMHPEKAMQALLVLAQLIQAKQAAVIDDIHLKMLLAKINPEKKEFTITRK